MTAVKVRGIRDMVRGLRLGLWIGLGLSKGKG